MDPALAALLERQKTALTTYMEAWMDDVLGEAQRIVPLEEGTLAGSADRITETTGDQTTVTGFFAQVYAARQHEELDWNHRDGRQAKYLETPFKAALPRLQGDVAQILKKVT